MNDSNNGERNEYYSLDDNCPQSKLKLRSHWYWQQMKFIAIKIKLLHTSPNI